MVLLLSLLLLLLLLALTSSYLVVPTTPPSPPRSPSRSRRRQLQLPQLYHNHNHQQYHHQQYHHHHAFLSTAQVAIPETNRFRRRRPTLVAITDSSTRLWNHAASSPSSPSSSSSPFSSLSSFLVTWIPSFFHFPLQLIVLLSCYALHLTVLSQHAWPLPIEIVDGLSSVGYDSIVGMLVAGGYGVARIRQRRRANHNHNHHLLPWNLPMDGDDHNENDDAAVTNDPEPSSTKNGNTKKGNTKTATKRNIPWPLIRFRVTFVTAAALLVKTYFQTGRLSLFWEDLLYEQSAAGWPLTAARMRSLQVLLGHLSWVGAGTMILWLVPRPPSFLASFRAGAKPTRKQNNQQNNQQRQRPRQDQKYHWFRVAAPWSSPTCHWLWWTLGGYLVSSWLFNVADTVNQIILPAQVLRDAAQAESVVAQLVRPEYNDIAALLAGYIAPCVSAPLWEELLYRGFLLAGLHAVTRSFGMAALVQALVFSAHHMSVTGALPLAVLGGAWAVLYAHSRNLWTVVAVHALWNSRVFLGSWLGL